MKSKIHERPEKSIMEVSKTISTKPIKLSLLAFLIAAGMSSCVATVHPYGARWVPGHYVPGYYHPNWVPGHWA